MFYNELFVTTNFIRILLDFIRKNMENDRIVFILDNY